MAQSGPVFSTRTPELLNTGTTFSFSLPILNSGSGAAASIFITNIQLSSATRVEPAGFPVFAGQFGPGNVILASASFNSQNLRAGDTHLITVQGTYQSGVATFGFQVNRFVAIPAPTSAPVALLQAHVAVSAAAGLWAYTVANNEAGGSPNYINAFSLDIAAPISVLGTPPGWQNLTNNSSYILWYAADQQEPYPNHIAPGASLAGFTIQSASKASESTGFSITAWNHQTNQAGLVRSGTVFSPRRGG